FFDIICQHIQEINFCNIMSKIIKIANVYNVQQEIIPIAAESVVPYNRPNEAIRPDDHIFIKFNKSSIKVKYDEILYIKNAGNTLKIETTTGKPFYYRSTLKKFYESLPTHTFTRINKSIVVNYTKIDKYKNQTVYIQNETFKVSRIYSVRLKELLRLR
ncbi:MAG: LytTR family transcriptional regulator DNA-binding domain-containing protein, partial [Bacteroidales bacterium]